MGDVGESHGRRRAGLTALAGMFLVVFAARCAWVQHAGSQLPFWDEWFEIAFNVEMLDQLAHGQPILHQLARPLNEHRLLTTRVTSLSLLALSGYWDIKGEAVVSAAVRAIELTLLLALLRPLLPGFGISGLIGLLVAVGALPLSPFNLLSGLQIDFVFVDILSVLGLALLATRIPLDAEGVAAATVCLLLAFLSMASGIVAPIAGIAFVLLQAAAARRFDRPRAVLVIWLACLAGFGLVLTPRFSDWAPLSLGHSLSVLLRCLAFPWPSPLFVVQQVPLVLLTARQIRRARPQDPGWLLVALGTWTLTMSVAVAGSRAGGPAEQYFEFLSLSLVWNYVALVRLLGEGLGARVIPRQFAPALWASAGVLALVAVVWVWSWPIVRNGHEAGPSLERRFRESVIRNDWRQYIVELRMWEHQYQHRPPTENYGRAIMLNERYAVPAMTLRLLLEGDRRLLGRLPPSISTIGHPSTAASALESVAASWPLTLILGMALLLPGAIGLRREMALRAG